MIRTHLFACSLLRAEADALNHESGQVYTNVLVRHYRVFRRSGHWLSPGAGELRLCLAYGGRARRLHPAL